MTPKLLRALAIIIAVAGTIDPAINSAHTTRREVAVIATDSAQTELATRVREQLRKKFVVIPAPFAPAAATVLVGNTLPAVPSDVAGIAFAVVPEAGPVIIEALHVPTHAELSAQATITAVIRVRNQQGRELQITLHAGDVVLDRSTVTIGTNDESVRVPLRFVAHSAGATLLRVEAGGAGDRMTTADVVLDVRDQRSAVLFYDPRPSWLSTFVRRAIEDDPRFIVSSRTVTARTIGVDAGAPPATLADPATLERFAVIVIGAPELLSTGDVAALEQFLRKRGGTVVLLPDNNVRGPFERLIRVVNWSAQHQARPIVIGDALKLRAASVLAPVYLPPGASHIAGIDSTATPVIWETAVGAGRLIFSGALDAWRYRDPERSNFNQFWRQMIGSAAAHAIPPITISISDQPAAPGASTDFSVALRSVALGDMQAGRVSRTTASASLITPEARIPLRLWPDPTPGRLRGELHAPKEPGVYTLTVSANGSTADAQLVVASATKARPDQSGLLTQWAASHGGTVFRTDRLDELAPVLERALQPERHPEIWHPLRSAWWLFPFTLFLAAEWWWRRRHGMR